MVTMCQDPERAWAPYRPDTEAPWDLRRAGHLYRRAAFGASAGELRRALEEGPQRTIDRLLRPAGVDAFHRTYDDDEARAVGSQDAASLRAWWLRRMLTTPHPLLEKMTLFWHGHFATSNAQVQNARLMREHLARLRAHALGSFSSLLLEVVRDPALLLGLGVKANRKAAPSADLARAFLDVFTVGREARSERDLEGCARALTGDFVLRGKRRFLAREHDDGPKTILGQRGAFGTADAVRIAAGHPATARRLVHKLYRWLISEADTPDEGAILAPLVATLAREGDIGKLVERMLRSKLFFSAAAYRRRVKSPVEFALGIAKAGEGILPTMPLARDLARLGQDLCRPPTVKGWAGGRHWINGATWTGRANLAFALLGGSASYRGRLNPAALARKHGHTDRAEAGRFFLDLLLQGDVEPEVRTSLLATLARPGLDRAALRRFAHAVVTSPEFHLA